MSPRSSFPRVITGVVPVLIGALLFVVFHQIYPELGNGDTANINTNTSQTAAVDTSPLAPSSSAMVSAIASATAATTTGKSHSKQQATLVKISPKKSKVSTSSPVTISITTSAQSSTTPEVARIQSPYATSPDSFDTVNVRARAALVNILCMPQGGSLKPISGSGVIIDPRGVILTNAHVAQYVLLSESPKIDLTCVIRTGSPAVAKWTAEVLYISPVWVHAHAADITSAHATGTGEYDYALLRIVGSLDGLAVPDSFPYLSYDTREAIGFLGDQVLGAAYPAEFIGGLNAENNLNAVSSVSPIKQLLTFGTSTVDIVSIGGVIEAQAGSSGGLVTNAWSKLLALITTTSDGATTAERNLRAVTMSYINRDIQAETGSDLRTFLQGDLAAKEDNFNTNYFSELLDQYIQRIRK